MPRQLNRPWLDAYLEYIDNTENPKDYNLWAGISAISASMKRNVYVWRNYIQFFPNQYIILVGPPGIGKGSAIHPSVAIVKEAATVNYLSDKITAEKIIEKLATGVTKTVPTVNGSGVTLGQDHTATILAKELPVFLSSSEWMHSLLCQLWDENEFEYDTKHKGTYKIVDMCVGMLGACVPDFIRKLSRDSLAPITGGFTARTIFVYATDKAKLLPAGWGRPLQQVTTLRKELVNDLKHISKLQGEMFLDADAKKFWDFKYGEHNKTGDFDTDASANFKSRISSHIIKTAISISLSESDTLTITRPQLERATFLIEDIGHKVDVVFRAVGESPTAAIQEKVLDYVIKKGVVSRVDLMRKVYRDCTDEQLTQVLFTLQNMEAITQVSIGGRLCYKSMV